MPGTLPAFFAAPQILSIACSTFAACTSCALPPLSAVARSYGPTKRASMPGVAAIASTLASAVAVSIIANVSVPSLVNGGGAGALQRHGAQGTPAALPQGRIFRCGGELPCIVCGVDHRRDGCFSTEVERAGNEGEIVQRHAYGRCGSGVIERKIGRAHV